MVQGQTGSCNPFRVFFFDGTAIGKKKVARRFVKTLFDISKRMFT